MSQILTEDDINQLLSAISGRPSHSDEYKAAYVKAYQSIADMVGFNYNTEEDMKDCADTFLRAWFDEYESLSQSCKSLPRILSELSGKDIKEIILDETLLKEFYSHSMVMYNCGAIREKDLISDYLNKFLRVGILKTPKDN